jgi:hypothetical protein
VNSTGLYWADRQQRPCRFHDEPAEEALWRSCEAMTSSTKPDPIG